MAGGGERWRVLALGVLAQASSCSLVYGVPFLVPAMRASSGLSLAQAGAVVAAPTVGLLLTLVAWGAAADRYGERRVIALGLLLAGLVAVGAALVPPGDLRRLAVLLGLAGAAAASVNAASGRLVMGWFTAQERGTAMGIRQTAQPLGVAVAAVSLPVLAASVGIGHALLLPAGLCLLSAVLVALLAHDAPREPAPRRTPSTGATATAAAGESPYRTPVLWRLHGASSLLVLPQFAVAAFALDYLVHERHWAAGRAGAFVGAVQVLGAAGRIATGWWSDRVGSRLRPMRQLAVGSAAVMLALALGDLVEPWVAVAAIGVGAVVTVADNGLAFTATAEIAGTAWSGRALGIQNTAQNVVAALTPPALGAVIGGWGYAAGFALASVAPLVAVPVTPVGADRRT